MEFELIISVQLIPYPKFYPMHGRWFIAACKWMCITNWQEGCLCTSTQHSLMVLTSNACKCQLVLETLFEVLRPFHTALGKNEWCIWEWPSLSFIGAGMLATSEDCRYARHFGRLQVCSPLRKIAGMYNLLIL